MAWEEFSHSLGQQRTQQQFSYIPRLIENNAFDCVSITIQLERKLGYCLRQVLSARKSLDDW